MIGYCPAVYLMCYFVCTCTCMFMCQTLLYLDRGRSEFRVERERGREAESFNEASEGRTDYLQHYIQIFLIPFNID